jgi:hypothetical protein
MLPPKSVPLSSVLYLPSSSPTIQPRHPDARPGNPMPHQSMTFHATQQHARDCAYLDIDPSPLASQDHHSTLVCARVLSRTYPTASSWPSTSRRSRFAQWPSPPPIGASSRSIAPSPTRRPRASPLVQCQRTTSSIGNASSRDPRRRPLRAASSPPSSSSPRTTPWPRHP